MTLTIYILIAIPICILTILIWAYFDYQKYKQEHHLIILLSFLFPTLSHAQYVDNEKCCISFKTYENHQGILEYIKENVTYQFIPSSNAWKVTVKNNTNETIWLNWEKANFIINGRASGISLQPHSTESNSIDIIKNNSEITRTVTASKLIAENKINRIYDKQDLKKGGKTSVSITLPIGVGGKPQFFHIFNFIVTQDN